jgi:transposase InsO family protein
MLGNGHVRFGRRAAETGQSKDRNRAAVRPHTYVATWAGVVCVAFVIDAYARRILGWRRR